jgi:hypothetical protein
MECQIKNLPVFAPLSHCRVHRLSREDLRDQLRGVRRLTAMHPDISNINRGEIVPVILEEFLESGIHQLD